jgi:uncharacterized Zn finger protein
MSYDDWGRRFPPPSRPIPVEDGITARSARGDIGVTWWSRRFIAVLESFALGTRLSRGKNYARRGQVLSMLVTRGKVSANVQGSRSTPYRVSIGCTPFAAKQWNDIEARLAHTALICSQMLAGEVPPELESLCEEVGAALFPTYLSELTMKCSCPDYESPCKHIAATFYLLAEAFDDDPFLILQWRGRTRDALLDSLQTRRTNLAALDAPPKAHSPAQEAQEALEVDVSTSPAADNFWTTGAPIPEVASAAGRSTTPVIQQLPVPPIALGGKALWNVMALWYEVMSAPAN